MPVYDQGYRRHQARRPLRALRFWPITREALRLLLRRWTLLGLLVLAWVPVLFRAGQIFILTRFPEAQRLAAVDGRLFGEFLNVQILPMLLVTVLGGAGLVAGDLRSGAILVYLSRPLTHRDYVLGKLGVLLALNLAVSLVPGLLLYAFGVSVAPERLLAWSQAWIAPALALYALVLSLVLSLVALALSALSRSARVAGLAFFVVMMALGAGLTLLELVVRSPALRLLSIWGDLEAVGAALFGLAVPGDSLHWAWPALALAGLGLACLAVLRRRVRAVEVVR